MAKNSFNGLFRPPKVDLAPYVPPKRKGLKAARGKIKSKVPQSIFPNKRTENEYKAYLERYRKGYTNLAGNEG